MDRVTSLCNDAIHYPQNFAGTNMLEYLLSSYHAQITQHQHRLFTSEDEASLDFWELGIGSKGMLTSTKGHRRRAVTCSNSF